MNTNLRVASLALCTLAAFAAFLPACSGTTRTGVAYTLKADREVEAFLPGDLKAVHAAGEAVIAKQFRYRVTRAAADAREGIIEALTAKGDIVRVETYYVSERVTRTEVFVGPLGDEPIMKDILNAMEKSLRK